MVKLKKFLCMIIISIMAIIFTNIISYADYTIQKYDDNSPEYTLSSNAAKTSTGGRSVNIHNNQMSTYKSKTDEYRDSTKWNILCSSCSTDFINEGDNRQYQTMNIKAYVKVTSSEIKYNTSTDANNMKIMSSSTSGNTATNRAKIINLFNASQSTAREKRIKQVAFWYLAKQRRNECNKKYI